MHDGVCQVGEETGEDRSRVLKLGIDSRSGGYQLCHDHPSTYGPQLHWLAQKCTIYKFKLEFEILLRNSVKMFINVHRQKIKTPCITKAKKNSTATSTTQRQAITHSSSKHHSTITTHHGDFTETCPRRDQNITERSPKHHQKTNKTTKQHRDITKKRQRQDRDTT